MTKSTLSVKNKRFAIIMFCLGVVIGALFNDFIFSNFQVEQRNEPTVVEQAKLQDIARVQVSKELASPTTATFSNMKTRYESPFFVIQEDITETLRTGALFKSSYIAAFIKDEKSWAPIYVKQMFK